MTEIDEKDLEKAAGGVDTYIWREPDAAFCDNYTPGSQLITDEPNAVLPKDYTCGACEWYQAGVGCHNPEIVSGRRII